MEIEGLEQSEPYIVITGKPGEENVQFFIYCAKHYMVPLLI